MSSPLVLYESDGVLATVTLNRPEKHNALSAEMLQSLRKVFNDVRTSTGLRSVILTGGGNSAFCSGTDIKELTDINTERARQISVQGQALCNEIEKCPIPVIAAINGITAGGGLELALACHLRIASRDARLSLPEIKLGLIPGYGGTQRLMREIGRARTLEMMLTGKSIRADEAKDLGVINRVVESSSLLTEAQSLARDIGKLAPLAVRACLQAVIKGAEMPLADALKLETTLFASLFESNDVREGTHAFLEKRQPVFKGT